MEMLFNNVAQESSVHCTWQHTAPDHETANDLSEFGDRGPSNVPSITSVDYDWPEHLYFSSFKSRERQDIGPWVCCA